MNSAWPQHPVIYEINTWVWLQELCRKLRRPLDLGSVPADEWDALAALGIDAVWFMGVWERSPAGIAIASRNAGLMEEFQRVLPDFTGADNVGSPYCVRRYAIDSHLGGDFGLAAARAALAERGIKLILDFVPNHVAPDHPWVADHPDYFVQGSADDLRNDPASFIAAGDRVIACGRDPYFPAWPDVVQLNAFSPGLRQAAIDAVASIATQCDGVRCDMAMLMMNDVFSKTWGGRAGSPPKGDYWSTLIPAVRAKHPGFLFMAEAYWALEWALQQQGFDFCYDKRLYDRLIHDDAECVRLHLCAEPAYQNRLVRMIENHDEPRAAAAFHPAKERAAAVVCATTPGARLFHEGQFSGRKAKLPVFLGRRPNEPRDADLELFYHTLLRIVRSPVFHAGAWSLCDRGGWPDNPSWRNIIAWCWRKDDEGCMVVVNLSDYKSQALVRLPWPELTGRQFFLTDAFSNEVFPRNGADMVGQGLYVDLPAWGCHVFHIPC